MQYPDWVMEAKKSRELLSWIQDPVHSIKKFHSQLFIKCQEENCMFILCSFSLEGLFTASETKALQHTLSAGLFFV